MPPNRGILLQGVFDHKLLNNPLAPCFLLNIIFYYPTLHIRIKALVFLYLSLHLLGFYYLYSTLQTMRYYCFIYTLNFQYITYLSFINSFKLFKTTVSKTRVKINFSIYFAFYFNIVFLNFEQNTRKIHFISFSFLIFYLKA